MTTAWRTLVVLASLLPFTACADDSNSNVKQELGAACVGTGGKTGVTGDSATGGCPITGGSSAIGGTSAAGGCATTGGSPAIGGTSAVGGCATTGGSSAIGGTSAVGGCAGHHPPPPPPPCCEPPSCGEPPPCEKVSTQCETAFAMGDVPFSELGVKSHRWGWAIQMTDCVDSNYPLLAGAAHNDPNKGIEVGSIKVTCADGNLDRLDYELMNGYRLAEAHVYASCVKPNKLAPGKFDYSLASGETSMSFDKLECESTCDNPDGNLWLIAHAVVCGSYPMR